MAINKTYEELVESAKPKRTTDDCYTPGNIYEVVRDYVANRYDLDPGTFVRPFYSGGDYQSEDYTGKVVVDNPPFSILKKIKDFFVEHSVPFFLFCPANNGARGVDYGMETHIACGIDIVYENGASVSTSFVTNLEAPCLRTDSELRRNLDSVNRQNRIKARKLKHLTSWRYPKELVTTARLCKLARYGVDVCFAPEEIRRCNKLDNMPPGAKVFGGGFLLTAEAVRRLDKAKELEAKAKELEMEQSGTLVELSDRELALVYGE